MLVVRGTMPTDDIEYEPDPGSCYHGTFADGIGIFNLNHHKWESDYDPGAMDKYSLGRNITDVIGENTTRGRCNSDQARAWPCRRQPPSDPFQRETTEQHPQTLEAHRRSPRLGRLLPQLQTLTQAAFSVAPLPHSDCLS